MVRRWRGSDATRRRIGGRGELAALVLLIMKGYRLRHRNWQAPGGELDLVVERGGTVVFVEVKTRSGELYGGAAAAVVRDKRRAMVRAAAAYLGRFGLWERSCRFDLVTVERIGRMPWWRLRHLPGAFEPDLGRLM
jgi:putative endonuclease